MLRGGNKYLVMWMCSEDLWSSETSAKTAIIDLGSLQLGQNLYQRTFEESEGGFSPQTWVKYVEQHKTDVCFGFQSKHAAWGEADFTLMSAETLISGGVRVMDGHCWGPSPMLIQDLANSPRAHSFWMEHLDRGDHKTMLNEWWNLKKTLKVDSVCRRTFLIPQRELLRRDFGFWKPWESVIAQPDHRAHEVQGQRVSIKVRTGESLVAPFHSRTDTFSLPGFMVCCPQIHEVLQFPNASFTPQLSVFLPQHKRRLDSRLHMLLWQPFPQALRSGGHSLMVE